MHFADGEGPGYFAFYARPLRGAFGPGSMVPRQIRFRRWWRWELLRGLEMQVSNPAAAFAASS